jgi:tRNA 2-thiouridine synthesizing protein A
LAEPAAHRRREVSAAETFMSEQLVDARGLKCPLPILKAKKALKVASVGDLVRVLATDPLSPYDFADLCRLTGDELVESSDDQGVFSFLIRRRS